MYRCGICNEEYDDPELCTVHEKTHNEENTLNDEKTLIDEKAHIDEKAYIDENTHNDKKTLVEDNTLIDETTPGDEKSLIDETTSGDEKSLIDETMPGDEKTLIGVTTPGDGKSLIDETTPGDEKSLIGGTTEDDEKSHNDETLLMSFDFQKTYAQCLNEDPVDFKPETDNSQDCELKPYKCYCCKARFTSSDQCLEHVKEHDEINEQENNDSCDSQSKPYKCPHCGVSFSKSSQCWEHLKGCEAPRPYKCHFCEACFSKSRQCWEHLKEHSREGKPFKCTVCQQKFLTDDLLYYHKINAHNIDDSKTFTTKKRRRSNRLNGKENLSNTDGLDERIKTLASESTSNDENTNNLAHINTSNDEQTNIRAFANTSNEYIKNPNIDNTNSNWEQTSDEEEQQINRCNICEAIIKKRRNGKKLRRSCISCVKKTRKKGTVRKLLDIKSYTCYCGDSFVTPRELKTHLGVTGHSEKSASENINETNGCKDCEKVFKNATLLKLHMKTHREKALFPCQYCGKTFKLANYRLRHERCHTKEQPFMCRHCGMRFSDSSNRNRHEKSIRCNAGRPPLIRPRRIERGEHKDMYNCRFCKRVYKQQSRCAAHERTHTGEKPYQCQFCGKMFADVSARKRHERIHTGEKPYQCEFCGKSFNQASTLKQHKLRHTGQKPYSCQLCEKHFASASDRKKHEKSHHQDQKSSDTEANETDSENTTAKSANPDSKPRTPNIEPERLCVESGISHAELKNPQTEPRNRCSVSENSHTEPENPHTQAENPQNESESLVSDNNVSCNILDPRTSRNESITQNDAQIERLGYNYPSQCTNFMALNPLSTFALSCETYNQIHPLEKEFSRTSESNQSEHVSMNYGMANSYDQISYPISGYYNAQFSAHSISNVTSLREIEQRNEYASDPRNILSNELYTNPNTNNDFPRNVNRNNVTQGPPIQNADAHGIVNFDSNAFGSIHGNVPYEAVHANRNSGNENTSKIDVGSSRTSDTNEPRNRTENAREINHFDTKTISSLESKRDDENFNSGEFVRCGQLNEIVSITESSGNLEGNTNTTDYSESNVLNDAELKTETPNYGDIQANSDVSNDAANEIMYSDGETESYHSDSWKNDSLDNKSGSDMDCKKSRKRKESRKDKTSISDRIGQEKYERQRKIDDINERTKSFYKEREPKCCYCNVTFAGLSELEEHKQIHKKEKLKQCQFCGKRFLRGSDLNFHEMKHTGERPLVCKFCDKTFIRPYYLRQHEKVHTGNAPERQYSCQYCAKTFINLRSCEEHERIHTGEHPYQCHYCEEKFKTMGYRTVHERKHLYNNPFECKQCGKQCTSKAMFKNHLRTHTGEKPFKCTHCAKAFSDPSSRIRHERIHTGEKPYHCTVCQKSFNQSSTLKQHLKSHNK